ncbi:hypothetical protein BDQ12DRAFT_395137 [Crucibulum laeve]|uniref:Uncharacterized protein n=1 Tax=Crucibulum laeve TaxID=68775 RepID=A0A5C3MAI0_9AGAR|nr:hypothetical protein BDQ12DRAFT_395137 [Crucibulum laeve]
MSHWSVHQAPSNREQNSIAHALLPPYPLPATHNQAMSNNASGFHSYNDYRTHTTQYPAWPDATEASSSSHIHSNQTTPRKRQRDPLGQPHARRIRARQDGENYTRRTDDDDELWPDPSDSQQLSSVHAYLQGLQLQMQLTDHYSRTTDMVPDLLPPLPLSEAGEWLTFTPTHNSSHNSSGAAYHYHDPPNFYNPRPSEPYINLVDTSSHHQYDQRSHYSHNNSYRQ